MESPDPAYPPPAGPRRTFRLSRVLASSTAFFAVIGLTSFVPALMKQLAPDSPQRPNPSAVGAPGEAKDLGDGTRLAPYEVVDGVKVFKLHAAPVSWETAPGKVRQAYAFNGIVPGPVIRVNEGDPVRIVVENDLPEPTAVHWHGMDLPNSQDGVPGLTQPEIEPGESYTYEWKAISPGTHWYHSHMHGEQEGKGLYGSLEVVPRTGDIRADRDYRIMIGDGALGFVFNGKSFPATEGLSARVGEKVRIRLIGTGPEMIHPIHLHSGHFTVVAQDGRPLPVPQEMDTLNVGVGQTYDIVWTPTTTGKWMIHCHIFSHSETHEGMAGLVSVFQVDPAVVSVPDLPLIN
ncbi:multicopper oxidase domain-containing protein [Streptomyces sp. 11x1]|uniref:multicopper oxidase family protein n=1 Tax=Streptomyces sp. 11x1 TaxID=3038642 RepID=UPI00292F4E03|nr:multicopper oxidase domain-containing protein [Streptomyces sp. 11x1]WNZ10819.1 multicopper oxidase domain-containing protein [Streptomyces sp. 11x1]